MRKLMIEFLLVHTWRSASYLEALNDKALLKLYDETRDSINSFSDI